MIRLILVRHGETDSSRRGTFCGWTDSPLNEEGKRQARTAASKLTGIPIDIIYSSPSKRALETAEIINNALGLRITCFNDLRERNFGRWEDLTYSDIGNTYPGELSKWQNDWVNYRIEDGESAYQAHERVAAFADNLIKVNSNRVCLVVTHAGCIRSILSHLLGMGIGAMWRFKIECGGVTSVEITDDGYAYLTMLNG